MCILSLHYTTLCHYYGHSLLSCYTRVILLAPEGLLACVLDVEEPVLVLALPVGLVQGVGHCDHGALGEG